MNKRYIDFVPVDKKKASSGGVNSDKTKKIVVKNRPEPKKIVPKMVEPKKAEPKKIEPKEVVEEPREEKPIIKRGEHTTTFSRSTTKNTAKEVGEISVEEIFVEKTEPAGVSTGLKSPKLGVIEDYHPKFVQAEVKKRPLGTKPTVKKPVQGQGVKVNTGVAVQKKAAVGVKKVAPASSVRANFINVGKVEKRPLSKNVYARKPVIPERPKKEQESKKPVVIIAKPEKDSKVGLIIAVILTIILGAAAGTVAFLLLPK